MTPLAAILAERGISQYELRRRTLLAMQTISSAYHGRGVSFGSWVKIAKALDVKLADLSPPAEDSAASVEHGSAPG
jgi:DNA-binding Xre family transcriptional regulator